MMTKKIVMISILIIIVLSFLVYNFYFGSDVESMTSELENTANTSFNKNASMVNNSLNTTNNSAENIMLISLEKPPDKVIGG